MDAIIGSYRARMEETGLVLIHPTGISFHLAPREALGLNDFINAYQDTLKAILSRSLQQDDDLTEVEDEEESSTERETDPRIASVVVDTIDADIERA